jgi:glycosyltransferase involved in cell wall biosynthesis
MRNFNSILLVANYDSNVGYAWWLMESFWAVIAEHYCKSYNIILVYPSISHIPEIIDKSPLHVIRYDFSGNSFFRVVKHCFFLRRFRVQIIYLTDRTTWQWKYFLYRLCGVRLIVTHEHAPGLRTEPRGIKALLKATFHRIPWLRVDGAIGATDFIRKRLINVNKMPEKRSFSAPNGLPEQNAFIAPSDLHQLFHIPCNRKIIVMVSRAHRYKGVDFAIHCLDYLLDKGRNDVHFLFIGDGPDLKFFKEFAQEKGVYSCCTFPGKQENVKSLLAGADIAFHPSRGEVGYSLSILEYMQAGLPVVVPDNPSVCQATEHNKNGFIYREGDVQSASEYLCQLLNDKNIRLRQGEYARESVKKFSLTFTHKALIQSINEVSRLQNM